MKRFPSHPSLIALLVWATCWSSGAALAQEVGEPLCGDCHTTGRIANKRSASELRIEEGVTYCSIFMERDPETLGMDWMVCPKCRTPSVQESARREFEFEFEKRRKWLDARHQEVGQHAGTEVAYIRTDHFRIAWDIPRMKVGRRTLKLHDVMHLYADRMEELYQKILDLHGITERQTRGALHELFLFESQRTARRVGNHVLEGGMGSAKRKSLIGATSRHVRYYEIDETRTDKLFHQSLAHTVSHHLHNDIDQRKHWLFKRYGWVYEGLAHYIEIRMFGPPVTSCQQEAAGATHWKGKNWEGNVRKLVAAGNEPPFQDILQKGADALSAKDRLFAWSYIDYLIWLDSTRIPKFIGLMKGPQAPTRDALKQAYGLTVGQFVDGWREFVLTEYATRGKDGPRVREFKSGPGGDVRDEE